MRVLERTARPVTAELDGIVEAATLGAAGPFTLNAGNVVNESANPFDGTIVLSPPRRVLISSVGDDSAVNFTILGYDRGGALISEIIAGANADAVVSTYVYSQIVSVSADDATTDDVTVGWTAESISAWLVLGNSRGPAGFLLSTQGNDEEGAEIDIEVTTRNILRDRILGDLASDTRILDADNSPHTEDMESVCLVPYAAVRVRAVGNTVPIILRCNPNYTV